MGYRGMARAKGPIKGYRARARATIAADGDKDRNGNMTIVIDDNDVCLFACLFVCTGAGPV